MSGYFFHTKKQTHYACTWTCTVFSTYMSQHPANQPKQTTFTKWIQSLCYREERRVCSSAWWTQRKLCRNEIHRKCFRTRWAVMCLARGYFHLTTEQYRSLYTSLHFPHETHTHSTVSFYNIACHWCKNLTADWFHFFSFFYVDISAKMMCLWVRHSAWTAINSQLNVRGKHQSVI